MYMDDIRLQKIKKKKELETLIQAARVYSQDIGKEFGIEKCAMLIMSSGKQQMTKGIELSNLEKPERSKKKKKRKLTSTWKY